MQSLKLAAPGPKQKLPHFFTKRKNAVVIFQQKVFFYTKWALNTCNRKSWS